MRLETYVKKVVRDLPCSKREKRNIQDELLDHLQALKEEFIDHGYDVSIAEQIALENFGSSQAIATELRKSLPLLDPYRRKWTGAGFFIYIISVVYLLFFNVERFSGRDFIIHRREKFPEYSYVYHNLIPFHTIKNYLVYFDHYTFYNWFYNLLGNIILFIPLGLLPPLLFSGCRLFRNIFIYILVTSLFFEVFQSLFNLGRLDIDDLLLNTLGGGLGYLLYRLIRYLHGKRTQGEKGSVAADGTQD